MEEVEAQSSELPHDMRTRYTSSDLVKLLKVMANEETLSLIPCNLFTLR